MKRKLLLLALLASGVEIADRSAYGADSVETVVVTASPIAQDKDQFATIVESLGRDELLKTGSENLGDSLAKLPGITATDFAAGASRPVIRGFDANRVRLLEDGLSSSDVSDVGPDHAVPIDPLAAQRIEVVRGAATLRYGSQAIGGVVNVLNNRVPLTLPDQPLSGDFSGSYGTGSNLEEGSALLDARLDRFAFHADGFARSTGDYDIPHGVQPNSFFEGDGISLGSSYFIGDNSRVGAAIVHNDARYGIPSDTTFIRMHQTKYIERSSLALDAGPLQTLNVDAGYVDYTHTEIDPIDGPLAVFNNKEWDTRAESVFGQMGPFSATAFGIQWQNRDFEGIGEARGYLLPTATASEAAFAFTQLPLLPDFRLEAGARVEHVDASGTPASLIPTEAHFTPVSGSTGALWDATEKLKLGLTLSSAARAPAQTELFAKGPHDGPGTFEIGDPDLTIERANSLEGTVRYRVSDVQFEGSLWGTQFTNFIYGQLTGRTCDDNGNCVDNDSRDFKELLYKQKDARFWGAEGKVSIPFGDWRGGSFDADLQGDYVRATFNDGGNVPRIPPYKLGAGLNWASERIDAGFMFFNVGRQDQIGAGETPTKGYNSLEVVVGWRPFSEHPGVQLNLVGHNLTNDVQRSAVSINKDEVEMPGRDVRLTMDIKV
ncbi:MAG: TonB-dependent receptor [Alphaproteobacteria bacterium]|nr:TonB-dependent receptor [Alphaproteobacteria bacterium]